MAIRSKLRDLTRGATVAGTLDRTWTSATFWPNRPFETGHTYRLVMTGDITNFNGVPIDFDQDGMPGVADGPNQFTTEFRGAPPDATVGQIFDLAPFADTDTSGYLDGDEEEAEANFFAINLLGLTPPPSYVGGYMTAHIRPLEWSNGDPILPIDLGDGIRLFSTSTTLNMKALTVEKLGLLGDGTHRHRGDGSRLRGRGGRRGRLAGDAGFDGNVVPAGKRNAGRAAGRSARLFGDGPPEFHAGRPHGGRHRRTHAAWLTIPIINLTIPIPVNINLRARSAAP
ncbi:MAG: hypothetical protein M5R36_19770 [Deltaproteobacteria bacterium]|nr:hypothetical protein [Deltaproteobacteria bacterium]